MRVRFTPRAVQDLISIADYIGERNPMAAPKVRDAILASLRTLAVFPEIGRKQNVEGIRKVAVRRYPYLIYYTADRVSDEIAVVTIRHAARGREYADI